MKALRDPQRCLADGLEEIRAQYDVPSDFPAAVIAEADRTKHRAPSEHADWTAREFVTLDPATSTDLDQAFHLEAAGNDILLHYALADIGWFLPADGALEAEAWHRGVTLYLPDGQARLYPPALSEGAASLLPDGPRPAVVVSVRCPPDGRVKLEGVVRAVVHSRAKLSYESVDLGEIPLLTDFAERVRRGEEERAAIKVDPPEQEIERDAAGALQLVFRPWLPSETANAALSLAANVAIAEALLAAGTGIFREMPPPDERAVARLRNTAGALGLRWPANATLAQFEHTVDPRTRSGAAFQFAVRRATGNARYVPYRESDVPWHAALGATYTHATAPMRRLADRYILEEVLALVSGRVVGRDAAFYENLAAKMNAADSREGAIERAMIDLAEAALLAGREGEVFGAVVTELDERGARIQLADMPVIARVDAHRVAAGEKVRVRLASVDPLKRQLRFQRVN